MYRQTCFFFEARSRFTKRGGHYNEIKTRLKVVFYTKKILTYSVVYNGVALYEIKNRLNKLMSIKVVIKWMDSIIGIILLKRLLLITSS